MVQLKVLFQDESDEAGALPEGLENQLEVSFNLGGRGRSHDHFEGLAEPKETALAEMILKLSLGPG